MSVARALIVCTTCRRGAGAVFAEQVASAARASGATFEVRTQECLWACAHGCSVLMQDPERYSYVAGGFRPDDPTGAEAVIAFFQAHGATPDGEVPFSHWPKAILGKFLCRIPPADRRPAKP
ncbi:MAG: DUF1636 family protein [Rhodothalassiaceae bacterium]